MYNLEKKTKIENYNLFYFIIKVEFFIRNKSE